MTTEDEALHDRLKAIQRYVGSPNMDQVLQELAKSTSAVEDKINLTSDTLEGTIEALNLRVRGVENYVAGISGSVARFGQGQDLGIGEEIESQIAPIRSELEGIRHEIGQLHEARTSLERIGPFLRENASFLTDAISAKGLIQALQGQVNAHEQRLSHLEGRRDLLWTRGLAIASAFIALLSVGILYLRS